jgi:CRISPR-associated exonuclease Cas4
MSEKPTAHLDWQSEIPRYLHADNDPSSHVESDNETFHPSQLARCKRQCLKSKCGLSDHDTETLGRFRVGTLLHEWLESHVSQRPGLMAEHELDRKYERSTYNGAVRIVGKCDVYDTVRNQIYDFKSRSGWYKFDPPNQRHTDQLQLYLDMANAQSGQICYVSKKDMEVRTWPSDQKAIPRDPETVDRLITKAFELSEYLRYNTVETVSDLPDPCGCWMCEQEADNA